jgi:hypothetical protein
MIHQIQTLWPTLVPNHSQIDVIQPISESRFHTVWKITTSDQSHFVLKHHLFAHLTKDKPYDLIAVENDVTTLLLKENASVSPIIATYPEHGFTIYKWCGEDTLDDHCQHHATAPITNKVIDTLLTLENSFQKHTHTLQSRIAPGSNREDVQNAFSETLSSLTDVLPNLIYTLTQQSPPNIFAHWQHICQQIQDMPFTLGPTDYNARNIVLSAHHIPYILELSKIGYDWPERRLIQYTTSLGAHLSTGRIIGLITPQSASRYAQKSATYRSQSSDQILTNLDIHHLIFYLLAALQCLQASTQPHHPWKNIDTRLNNIQTALSIPLSQTPSTLFFRHLFQP